MSSVIRCTVLAVAIATSFTRLEAQPPSPRPKAALPTTAPLVVMLLRDVEGVGDKLVGLAKAMPADKYDWRPGPGVRSVREVFLHVASDNYLLPALLGTPAPAGTGIDAKDFKTVDRFEKRAMSRDSVIAELEHSFTHLSHAMARTNAAQLATDVKFFGQSSTMQESWIGTTTHLHEHLGQSIAYARTNGVKPPWTK